MGPEVPPGKWSFLAPWSTLFWTLRAPGRQVPGPHFQTLSRNRPGRYRNAPKRAFLAFGNHLATTSTPQPNTPVVCSMGLEVQYSYETDQEQKATQAESSRLDISENIRCYPNAYHQIIDSPCLSVL